MKTKRILACILTVLMLAALIVPTVFADDRTVHIANADDLKKLAKKCQLDTYSQGLTVILDNDIDLQGEALTPIPIFRGSFEGGGYTISNFVLGTDGSNQGFFRYIEESGVVNNLKLEGTVAPDGSGAYVGGLVGTNRGLVNNCSFNGTVTGVYNVGGIAGENYGTIRDSVAYGMVSGKNYTGGIAGFNSGVLRSCENNASVNTSISESQLDLENLNLVDLNSTELSATQDSDTVSDSGGVAGGSTGAVIDCVNKGTVGYQHYGYNVGGIAGRQSGFMSNCRNYGSVFGRKDVGGVVGQMEPYMELQLSENLAQELEELNQLVCIALANSNDQTGELTAALNKIQGSAYSAAGSASDLSTALGNAADNTVDTTNELLSRLDYAIKAMQPVTHDFNMAAQNFSAGMVHLDAALDNLEMDDATYNEFANSVHDLSAAMKRISVELDYLAYLSALYFNKKGDGSVDTDSLKPDNYEEIEREYGYDYNMEDASAAKLRDAMLGVASDLATDGAKAAKANSKILEILDTYYLTPIYDTDGDGIPDQSRLEYARDEGSLARDNFTAASEYLASATDGLDELNTYLASLDEVQFSGVGSGYYDASDRLFSDLSGMAGGMGELNDAVDGSSYVLSRDLINVSNQFTKVMTMMANAISGELDVTIINDVSDSDLENDREGKVAKCANYGTVDADINVGGVAGAMGIEYEFDAEGDVTSGLGAGGILSKTYETKCVVRQSVNYGSVTGKKDNVGGIAGLTEIGTIISSEGYGSAKSTNGGYVGGIVGYSYTVVRDSYAMCNLDGDEYVGGIAGYGTRIHNCSTLIGMGEVTACSGAIAGWADMTVEENVTGNSYVHESLGAVDGISYSGKAAPVSYEELLKMEGLPEAFSQLKLTFVADGVVVKEIGFTYGGSVSAEEIPEVPEKVDYSGNWPDYDYSALYFSDTIEAVYTSKQATMAVDNRRDGSPMSILLVEGKFPDGASVLVNEYSGEGPSNPEEKVLEKWVLRIDGTDEAIGDYSVRYLPPALEKDSHKVSIYTYSGGNWTKVPVKSNGSYTVFDGSGDTVVFCAVESTGSTGLYIVLGCVGALAAAGIVCLLVFAKKKKTRTTK